jgi:hypothetical protein
MRARVYVFTFKEGLFAGLAHDLRLSVGSFEISVDHNCVKAMFDPSSLRVDGVAHGSKLDPNALSGDDKAEIEATLREQILETTAHPRIELNGTLTRDGAAFTVEAQLHLHGHSRGLRIPVRFAPDRAFAEVELVPSQFGIPKYKALAGAIRLQDRVVVRVELVEELTKLEALASNGEASVFEPV